MDCVLEMMTQESSKLWKWAATRALDEGSSWRIWERGVFHSLRFWIHWGEKGQMVLPSTVSLFPSHPTPTPQNPLFPAATLFSLVKGIYPCLQILYILIILHTKI